MVKVRVRLIRPATESVDVGISVGYGAMPRYRWISRQKDIYLRERPRGYISQPKPELDLEGVTSFAITAQLRQHVAVTVGESMGHFIGRFDLYDNLWSNIGCDVFPTRLRW